VPSDDPYVRVYQTIVDDPKFALVFDNDHHLATWLRLLMHADASWPHAVPIPASARKSSVQTLVEVGIIDVAAGRYRIHGLDAERQRRSDRGRASAEQRWSARNAGAMRSHSDSNARASSSSSILEELVEAPARARTPRQIVHQWLSDHGAAAPVGWVNTTLNELVKVYGVDRIRAVWDQAPPDVRTSRQFVQLAERSLAPTSRNGTTPKGLGPTVEEAENAFKH
jgi:hypothetical protein